MKQTFDKFANEYYLGYGMYDAKLAEAAEEYFVENPCVHAISAEDWNNMEGFVLAVAYVLPYEESKMNLSTFNCMYENE